MANLTINNGVVYINKKNAPSLDERYGPYESVDDAHNMLAEWGRCAVGLTVGIIDGSTIVEYWYQGGTELENLVQKQQGGGGGDQVQADWNQNNSSAVDYIKNKPTKVSAFTNDSAYVSANSQVFRDLTTAVARKADSSTTLAGYGITDAKIDPNTGEITLGSNKVTPMSSEALNNYLPKSGGNMTSDASINILLGDAIKKGTTISRTNISITDIGAYGQDPPSTVITAGNITINNNNVLHEGSVATSNEIRALWNPRA